MGYESRIYVVDRHKFNNGFTFCDKIATFDLSKTGYDFTNIFKDNDKELYVFNENGDSYIQKDRYDEPLTIAKAEDVIAKIQQNYELLYYRRTHDLYMFLESAVHNYDDLWCMHYGY